MILDGAPRIARGLEGPAEAAEAAPFVLQVTRRARDGERLLVALDGARQVAERVVDDAKVAERLVLSREGAETAREGHSPLLAFGGPPPLP